MRQGGGPMATGNHPAETRSYTWKDAAIVAVVLMAWVAVSGVALISR